MGECGQVPFRGGVVRFVFFKLFGTMEWPSSAPRARRPQAGWLRALGGRQRVACTRYALIWRARMQIFPRCCASLRRRCSPRGRQGRQRASACRNFVVRSVDDASFVRLPFDRACARDRRTAGGFRLGGARKSS